MCACGACLAVAALLVAVARLGGHDQRQGRRSIDKRRQAGQRPLRRRRLRRRAEGEAEAGRAGPGHHEGQGSSCPTWSRCRWAARSSSPTRTRSSTTSSRCRARTASTSRSTSGPRAGAWTFQHPGVVRVYCNIHPQMSAVVVVRDNPYFAKVAPDGTFTIERRARRASYALKAWHERAGEAAVEVTVPADGRGHRAAAVARRLAATSASSTRTSSARTTPRDEKY